MNTIKYLLRVIKAQQYSKNPDIRDVMGKLAEEHGELAVEVGVKTGFLSPDKGGKDGVFGEGIDCIIAILGVMLLDNPNMTEEDIFGYSKKKTKKWKKTIIDEPISYVEHEIDREIYALPSIEGSITQTI